MPGDGAGTKRGRDKDGQSKDKEGGARRKVTIDPVLRGYGLARTDTSSSRDHFLAWKRNVPLLYDSIVHHSLTWASLTCAFGVHEITVDAEAPITHMPMYFSSRTDATYSPTTNLWSSGQPGLLFVGNVDLNIVNTSRRKYLARFSESNQSSRISINKRIIHPGEVNRVRPSVRRPGFIGTHSDSPFVFIWDTANQPDRSGKMGANAVAASAAAAVEAAREAGDRPVSDAVTAVSKTSKLTPQHASIPELTLVGHKGKAEYALDFSASSDHVLSGGAQADICLWDLGDAESALTRHGKAKPRNTFLGHKGPIEGCAFQPTSQGNEFVSVGDDHLVAFWDARGGTTPTHLLQAHANDVNCCAWNPHDSNYVLTGSTDRHICLFDTRKLGEASAAPGSPGNTPGCVRRFEAHDNAVLNVRWSPHDRRYFASTDEKSSFIIWDMGEGDKVAQQDPQPLFRHAGHRAPVSDFDWSAHDPWAFMSVSDDSLMDVPQGGGTMQFWRIHEFVTHGRDLAFQTKLQDLL
ncbi:WD-40 repeat-containing protein MSI4 [Hondaea fermentalgiana]|uniref:WD-40 repeat-containing protein MSI4 n=1 Tax=Hondaea fermentalgiana TaxID=2315210 RepID=A0A2R5GU38_9STRA|nr:WD-40 repeat-containing protein MSI4 [Hondaea fermentalgiana]|eukprot:GBG34387.1 WD-40 repeat-containing protein MSI4 [Hondaea fermentalgiana]